MVKPVFPVSTARQQLLAARAHDMRTYAPEPERRLWRELRSGQIGVVFRRQVVLGQRYVGDFVACSVMLVVEVDGAIHARQRSADARRDRRLARLGYYVLRIPAALVMKDVAAAVALVRSALDVMLKPSRSVSPARRHTLAVRARDMRLHAQEPELALWRELRGSRLGVAFRRQVVLGNRYVADFVAPSLKLVVVKVDGAIRARRRCADERRDRDLRRLGYQVLRVPAALVVRDLPAAVALVRDTVATVRRSPCHDGE